jgi:hypothetical protein
MATSTNYGWSEPDNTSLVKDGAQAIRTLGDAIDTSLWNSGFGQAGKNKIINGDFGIWQRGTSFTQASTYCADRFSITFGGAVPTAAAITQQTFTPGTAPVAGYESQYFMRMVTTTIGSCTAAGFQQPIEDVRTFAGQTITISFWAKTDAARTVSIITRQNFGSGGSTATFVEAGTISATTSWARYSVTYAVPSVSGKTIGTSSFFTIGFRMTTVANGGTLDLWGCQAEYGSKATPFQTASGGSPQGELAMCQRYLPSVATGTYIMGGSSSTTNSYFSPTFQVPARVNPTGITISALSNYAVLNAAVASGTPTAIAFGAGSTSNALLQVTTTVGTPTIVSGQTAYLFLTSGNILFTGCEL